MLKGYSRNNDHPICDYNVANRRFWKWVLCISVIKLYSKITDAYAWCKRALTCVAETEPWLSWFLVVTNGCHGFWLWLMVVMLCGCRWRCSPSGHTRTRTYSPAARTGNTTPAARGATTPLPATTATTAATTGRGRHLTCVLHSHIYRAFSLEGLIQKKGY